MKKEFSSLLKVVFFKEMKPNLHLNGGYKPIHSHQMGTKSDFYAPKPLRLKKENYSRPSRS